MCYIYLKASFVHNFQISETSSKKFDPSSILILFRTRVSRVTITAFLIRIFLDVYNVHPLFWLVIIFKFQVIMVRILKKFHVYNTKLECQSLKCEDFFL